MKVVGEVAVGNADDGPCECRLLTLEVEICDVAVFVVNSHGEDGKGEDGKDEDCTGGEQGIE